MADGDAEADVVAVDWRLALVVGVDIVTNPEEVTTGSEVTIVADVVTGLDVRGLVVPIGKRTEENIAEVCSYFCVDTISEVDEGVTTASEVELVVADAASLLLVTAIDEVGGVTTASEVEPVTVDEATTVSPGTVTTEVGPAASPRDL